MLISAITTPGHAVLPDPGACSAHLHSSRFSPAVMLSLLVLAAAASAQTTRPAATQPAQYQPGIRINWKQHQVEVDITVILRDAPIELFACSPKNREHEAIVRIEAHPTHFFQALGLIGLTPGKPMHTDDEEKTTPASGDALDIDIAYSQAGQLRQEPIEAWMRHVDDDKPLGRLPWVFAGSVPLESGRIAADSEGTVIAVVDFSTSLIALAEHHSESNAELWLRPRTQRIPLIGTTGRLIVRAAPLRIHLDERGKILHRGQAVTRGELAHLVKNAVAAQPDLHVELTVENAVDRLEEKSLVALLSGLGIREDALAVFDSSGMKRPIIH